MEIYTQLEVGDIVVGNKTDPNYGIVAGNEYKIARILPCDYVRIVGMRPNQMSIPAELFTLVDDLVPSDLI